MANNDTGYDTRDDDGDTDNSNNPNNTADNSDTSDADQPNYQQTVDQILPGLPQGAKLTAGIDPLSTGIEIGGKVLDAVGNQLNNNTSQVGSQATQTTPGFGKEELENTNKSLPQTAEQAKQGITEAAKTQEQLGVPAFQQARSAAAQVANAQQQSAAIVRNNLQQMQGALSAAENAIQEQKKIAIENPRADTWKALFSDHPVMGSIALVLGGIGSGLTGGQNGALVAFENQVKGAEKAKADRINATNTEIAAQRGIAQNLLSASQIQALSNNMASIQTLEAAKAGVDFTAGQIGSATAQAQAAPLRFKIDQLLSSSQLNLASQFKNNNTYSSDQKMNLTLEMMVNGLDTIAQRKAMAQQIYKNQGISLPVRDPQNPSKVIWTPGGISDFSNVPQDSQIETPSNSQSATPGFFQIPIPTSLTGDDIPSSTKPSKFQQKIMDKSGNK